MKIYRGARVSANIYHPDGDAGDIGDGSQIHADLFCGDGVHIAPNVTIVGKHPVELGDGVTLAPGVVIYTSRPDIDRSSRNSYREGSRWVGAPVHLGDDVFVGANAVIAAGVRIADRVAIGAGSYVDADIDAPATLWAGAPASKRRDLEVAPSVSEPE